MYLLPTAHALIFYTKYLSYKYDTIFFLPISSIGIKPFFCFFSYFVRSAIGFRRRYRIFFYVANLLRVIIRPGGEDTSSSAVHIYIYMYKLLYMYTASHTHAHSTSLRRNQSFTISSHRQFSTKSIWIMCERCGARRQYREIERVREKRVTERERSKKIYMEREKDIWTDKKKA